MQATFLHAHLKLILWLVSLLIALAGISAFAMLWQAPRAVGSVTTEMIRAGEAPRPAFTPETANKVGVSSGFNALVSLTDRGFEPARVKIQSGQTVRFTNNSGERTAFEGEGWSADVWPQDFYEHTFSKVGVQVVTARGASVTIEVR